MQWEITTDLALASLYLNVSTLLFHILGRACEEPPRLHMELLTFLSSR